MDTNHLYDRNRFVWQQVRDCVEGANAIKRAQEIYLPMPSGMLFNNEPAAQGNQRSGSTYVKESENYSSMYLPWWHSNPAYRAYLQRARFPDITANTLRGLVGIATRQEPSVELPDSISHLEDKATPSGLSLNELYAYSVSEVLQVGKLCYVLDVNDDGDAYIATYCSESNIDWEEEFINGEQVLTGMVFKEYESDSEIITRKYWLDSETGNAMTGLFKDDVLQGEVVELLIQGSPLKRLPIVIAGAIDNHPEPKLVPLFGISDVAVAIYRKDADLSQAEFLTCNPTLFITGVGSEEIPRSVGSSIAVGLSNPQASAFYPATDTSALDHIRMSIQDLISEAMGYGASLIGANKKAAESAEALQLRKEASGATLVSTVRNVGNALEKILQLAAVWSNSSPEAVEYDVSIDFAERSLTPQGLTALVSSWMQGAISHDTLLDNLRASNIVDNEIDNEEEKERINIGAESMAILNG
jgi:hypothetical protein